LFAALVVERRLSGGSKLSVPLISCLDRCT